MSRLTPAQRLGLALLARPGAAAYQTESLRWRVTAHQDGGVLGTIHSVSLLGLREAGYVEMFNGGLDPLDFRQRLTDAGREYAASRPRSTGAGRP